MVKDHSDSEKGNPLPPHRLLLSINRKGYIICTYHGLCYTSRGALAGTRNSSMGKKCSYLIWVLRDYIACVLCKPMN